MVNDTASRLTTSISGSAVTTYTYDANGNLNNVATGSFGANLAYNGENQMVSYEDIGASNTQSFRYSAGGLKTVETTDFDENIVIWDGDDYDSEYRVSSGVSPGEVSKVYDRVGNIMLGENNASSSSTQYAVDFLGSVVRQINGSTGTIIDTFRYKPYGASLQGSPGPFTFGWTGNTGSRMTGLTYSEQYNRERHYSSTAGQWTTRDPLWPYLAPFCYAISNPTTWTDPSGLEPMAGLNDYLGRPDPTAITNLGGGVPGPGFAGGIDPCISLTLPSIRAWGVVKLSIKVKVCNQVYDNSCCPGVAASTCTKIQVGIALEAGVDPRDIVKILKDAQKLSDELNEAIKVILTLAGGFGNIMAGQQPKKGCPKPGQTFSGKVCVGGCLLLQTLKICQYIPGSQYVESKTGYCGIASIGVDGTLILEICQ